MQSLFNICNRISFIITLAIFTTVRFRIIRSIVLIHAKGNGVVGEKDHRDYHQEAQ